MAKRKATLSTVVDFMSEETQAELRERAGVLSPLPLESILPDPFQPRQLLPADIAVQVQRGELSPLAAVKEWVKRGSLENADPALQHDLTELRRLANSIEQHGLINPISVRRIPGSMKAPAGVRYLIITGERRYWAHVLLAAEERRIQEGLETRDPHQIKATIASEGISVRAHQLIENVLREDIDAVEKAQGFLALRYELSAIDYDPETAGEGVNHGSPLVSWERVEETLNVSRRYRQYVTAVLNLSTEAQALIKQHRLSERAIRPISQKLSARPELQLEALKQLVAWQTKSDEEMGQDRALTTAVQSLVDAMVAREEKNQARAQAKALLDESSKQAQQAEQLYTKIAPALRFLERLSDEELSLLAVELKAKKGHAQTIADLKQLHQKLKDFLEAVEIARPD